MTAPFAPPPPRPLLVIAGGMLCLGAVLPFARSPGWPGRVAFVVIAAYAAVLWGMLLWGIGRGVWRWWHGRPSE